MNVTLVEETVEVSETMGAALNITCDLYLAKNKLIPAIENTTTNSGVISVIKKLNQENLLDSCRWLSNVVIATSTGSTGITCDNGDGNLGQICNLWSSIKQFNSTINSINAYRMDE